MSVLFVCSVAVKVTQPLKTENQRMVGSHCELHNHEWREWSSDVQLFELKLKQIAFSSLYSYKKSMRANYISTRRKKTIIEKCSA